MADSIQPPDDDDDDDDDGGCEADDATGKKSITITRVGISLRHQKCDLGCTNTTLFDSSRQSELPSVLQPKFAVQKNDPSPSLAWQVQGGS